MTTTNPLLTLLFAMASAAILAACGTSPTPIAYYVPSRPSAYTPPLPSPAEMPPSPPPAAEKPKKNIKTIPTTPLGLSGPPLPSPSGGGCPPFASLVPPGQNRPETSKVADTLFRAGYVIAKIEGGRVTWRCGRALAAAPAPQATEPPTSSNASSDAPSPMPAPIPTEVPSQDARTLTGRLLPSKIADRDGWAADIADAFAALSLPATPEGVCAVIGVIGQESGFETDPVIAELGRIAGQELERRRLKYHVPRVLLDTALSMKSPDGRSYQARLDKARTERQLSAIYEDFIASVPLGRHLLSHHNPIRTLGPMQVGIEFVTAYASQRAAYGRGWEDNLRAVAFSRPGGIYFGTAHLLDYRAPYDSPIYRFADYNAGRYASRNAAFQAAVTRLSGVRLTLDGALTRAGDSLSDTTRATLSLGPRLGLDQERIVRELRMGRMEAFENTALYRSVFMLANERAGTPLPRAILPKIGLVGPKIRRNYLTTAWFAERVNSRYQACLARDGAGKMLAAR